MSSGAAAEATGAQSGKASAAALGHSTLQECTAIGPRVVIESACGALLAASLLFASPIVQAWKFKFVIHHSPIPAILFATSRIQRLAGAYSIPNGACLRHTKFRMQGKKETGRKGARPVRSLASWDFRTFPVAEDWELFRGRGRDFLLDGRANQVSPLGPGAVVVADVLDAHEVFEDKPGVRAALTDAAVCDDFAVAADAFRAVELLQRVEALECAIFVDGLGPGDIGRARECGLRAAPSRSFREAR